MQDRPLEAVEGRVARHVVGMLVHAGRHDQVLGAELRTVGARDMPNVAGLARAIHPMIEAYVPFEIEAVAVSLEIGEDVDVGRKLRIALRHGEIRHLGDATRRGRLRCRHHAAVAAVLGERPHAAHRIAAFQHQRLQSLAQTVLTRHQPRPARTENDYIEERQTFILVHGACTHATLLKPRGDTVRLLASSVTRQAPLEMVSQS